MPFDEAASDRIGTGAAGTQRMSGLPVGVPDSLMAGAAGGGDCHQGYQEVYHSIRIFIPICRAPCRSGLYCGISEVNRPGFGLLIVLFGLLKCGWLKRFEIWPVMVTRSCSRIGNVFAMLKWWTLIPWPPSAFPPLFPKWPGCGM